MNRRFLVYSLQKKRDKKKHKEETLQKAKRKVINQYYDIMDEIPYQPNYSHNEIVGIWNDKEKTMEFTNDLLQNLDKEIQLLSYPME